MHFALQAFSTVTRFGALKKSTSNKFYDGILNLATFLWLKNIIIVNNYQTSLIKIRIYN